MELNPFFLAVPWKVFRLFHFNILCWIWT